MTVKWIIIYICLVYFRCIDISNKNIINYIITIFQKILRTIFTPILPLPKVQSELLRSRSVSEAIRFPYVGDSFILVTLYELSAKPRLNFKKNVQFIILKLSLSQVELNLSPVSIYSRNLLLKIFERFNQMSSKEHKPGFRIR